MSRRLAMSWFQERGVTPDLADCPKCPHPWGEHEIEVTDSNTQQGGWIECSEESCNCRTIWWVDDIVKGRG